MKRFLHKLLFYGRKIAPVLVLAVLAGWFVYGGKGNAAGFREEEKVVKFYPNPASTVINFEVPGDVSKGYILQIFSFAGKKMAEIPVSSNKVTVTLGNDYYRGLYVFRLSERSGKLVDVDKFQVIR